MPCCFENWYFTSWNGKYSNLVYNISIVSWHPDVFLEVFWIIFASCFKLRDDLIFKFQAYNSTIIVNNPSRQPRFDSLYKLQWLDSRLEVNMTWMAKVIAFENVGWFALVIFTFLKWEGTVEWILELDWLWLDQKSFFTYLLWSNTTLKRKKRQEKMMSACFWMLFFYCIYFPFFYVYQNNYYNS